MSTEPEAIKSCLGCWGDCWRAYNDGGDEGDVRVGTRNSRAPSGEELRRTGVSTSVKPERQLLNERRQTMETYPDHGGDNGRYGRLYSAS